MDIRRHCQFLLDKEKGKPDAKLRYRIKWDGNRRIVAFSVGYRVDIDKWSTDTQRCKTNTTHGKRKVMASVINRRITLYEEAVGKVFREFEKAEHFPTEDEVRHAVNMSMGNADELPVTPLSGYDMFLKEQGSLNAWSTGTIKKMRTFGKRLASFGGFDSFGNFSTDRLEEFISYLRHEEGLRESTCAKQLALLKWYLRWAAKKGLLPSREFEFFSPKFKQTQKPVIFLNWEELMKVWTYDVPTGLSHLAKTRDIFCLCCFTSLRYSDAVRLKREDIHDDCIFITSVKTRDSLKIELNRYSREILEKYKNMQFPDGKALPAISNQKMNNYLKELCKNCGIDSPVHLTYYKCAERHDITVPKYELITTHAGRRTFICNALALGIPPQVVMKWTGHNDYKAMKPYIDIADSVKAEAMRAFDNQSPI